MGFEFRVSGSDFRVEERGSRAEGVLAVGRREGCARERECVCVRERESVREKMCECVRERECVGLGVGVYLRCADERQSLIRLTTCLGLGFGVLVGVGGFWVQGSGVGSRVEG